MPALSSIAKMGRNAWNWGKWGVGTNVGRMAVAGGIGAGIGVARGPEGLSWQDRAFAGAFVGASAGLGFNMLMRKGTWKMIGRRAWGGVKSNVSPVTQSFGQARAAFGLEGTLMQRIDFAGAELAKGIQNVPMIRAPQRLLGSMADITPPLLLGAGIIGGGVMATNAMRESRTRRFQESTGGLVQGMHLGRHR